MRSAFRGNDTAAFGVAHILCRRFLNSFSFSTKLEPAQIEIFTVDALEHFQYETLDDMVLFFKMARSGKFGTAKRGIDSNLVFGEWFPKYLELKAEARKIAIQAKKTANLATQADIQKTYSKAAHRNHLKKVRAHLDKITATMDRQMLEDTIVDWERDKKKQPYVKLLKEYRRKVK